MFFPIIFLDMDNTGLEFISALESEITIIHHAKLHRIGWIKSKTPMLIAPHDGRNCAHHVDDIFFGAHQRTPTNTTTLRIFDLNNDGVIDAQDSSYDRLSLWLDRNQDGECSHNEVIPIASLGMTIYLDFEEVYDITAENHIVNYSFTFDVDFINRSGKHFKRTGLKGWDVLLHSVPYVKN